MRAFKHHEYIVWCVRLWMGRLFSASYDCGVAFIDLDRPDVVHTIKGPLTWSDAIACDRRQQYLAIHDDTTYRLEIAKLSDVHFDQPDKSQTIQIDQELTIATFEGQ